MNIEQIAKEARLSMLRDFYGLSKEINICVNDDTEFLRRCLKKLAEQDVEPVAYLNPHGGVITKLSTGLERETFTIKLYTETQLLAAQQKAAEACAEYLIKGDHDDEFIASRGIIAGDWREYL